MKKLFILGLTILTVACKGDQSSEKNKGVEKDTAITDMISKSIGAADPQILTLENANNLVKLPMDCIGQEYPNKLNQTLSGKDDFGEPHELHPAFYGCFDWHSSVHGHWSLVYLAKNFPDMENMDEIKQKLATSITSENIQKEIEYFERKHEDSFERTYGWAWLLKLQQETMTWEDTLGEQLSENLKPLTAVIVENYMEFLPKLKYPIRVGEHENTAFGMTFAYDYAVASGNEKFKSLISKKAQEFYLEDDDCPVGWEPGGFDFLSPCLEEIDIMRRVLPKSAFSLWIDDFMPQLKNEDFEMEVGEVTDRTDGKLVHIDGLNFSRAWVFYGLSREYPDMFGHLAGIANEHVANSLPNVVEDSYEGGHWLGSFAIYALQNAAKKE